MHRSLGHVLRLALISGLVPLGNYGYCNQQLSKSDGTAFVLVPNSSTLSAGQ